METLEKQTVDVNATTEIHVHQNDLSAYIAGPDQGLQVTGPCPEPGPFSAILYSGHCSHDGPDYTGQWIAAICSGYLRKSKIETILAIQPDSLFVLEHDHRMINGCPCALQKGGEDGDYWADTRYGDFVAFVVPEGFQVRTLDDFNWVMRRMLAVESQIMAVEQSADVIAAKAIVKNAAAMRDRLYKRYASLENFFGPDLGEFARQQLEGKKERTFYSPFGSVGLRKKAGGLKILDKDVALSVAKMEYPDAVKVTEEFQISKLTAAQKQEAIDGLSGSLWAESDLMRKAFAVEPPSETVTIKTGVVGKE